MKRIVQIGLRLMPALIMAFALSVGAAALEKPTRAFYVNDFADVLTAEREAYFTAQGSKLEELTKAQIVVVTVSSLRGQAAEEYANALYNEWGVGGKEDSNGLLILLAPNERKIRVEVGYGLEGAVNDAKAGRLMDAYAMEYLKRDQFDEGVYQLYNALLPVVYNEYGMVPPEGVALAEEAPDTKERDGLGLGNIIFIVVLLIIISRFIGPRTPRGGGPPGGRRSYRAPPVVIHYGGFGRGGFGGFGGGGFGGGASGGGGRSGGGGASRGF